MPLICPYCQHEIAIRDPKPGRFKIRCPECQGKAALVITEDHPGLIQMSISALPSGEPQGEREPARPVPTSEGVKTTASLPESSRPRQPEGGEEHRVPPVETVVSSNPFRGLLKLEAVPDREFNLPPVGGYQMLKRLSQSTTSSVYLARQLSLDRLVALKVLNPQWGKDPAFVSRFTREAYAAAQLTHHNIAQIYDIGEDRGSYYISMEYVDGESLASILKKAGRLTPEVAVGYILQVARALKYAHAQNLVHRDIKPENLLLDAQGVVKVTKLGLVKNAGTKEPSYGSNRGTGIRTPTPEDSARKPGDDYVGSPAYMAPEQAVDASRVDFRADIYSLGCTLYELVTGRLPFVGSHAEDLIQQHASAPIIPPESLAREVTPALSSIISRMMAKRPEERFPTMDDAIRALEDLQGVRSTGPFSPREEHAQQLENLVAQFQSGQLARIRPWVEILFTTVSGLFLVLLLLAGNLGMAISILALWGTTIFVYFVLKGILDRTEIFGKFREFLFLNRPADWATIAAGLLVLLTLVVVFHWTFAGIALLFAAGGLAAGLYFGLDRPLAMMRNPLLDQAELLLRSMRLQGLNEESLRQFVTFYSGTHWEEFYENLFGYSAKRVARDLWGHNSRGKSRPRFAWWRDPIYDWLEARTQARKAARDRVRLQAIEEAGFIAEGMNLVTARRKARKSADAMVLVAAELRDATAQARKDPEAIAVKPRPFNDVVREAAEKPDQVLKTTDLEDTGPGFLSLLVEAIFGPRSRFLVGSALVGLCLFWAHQNRIFSAEEIKEQVEQAIEKQDVNLLKTPKINYQKRNTKALDLPMVPQVVLSQFNGWGPGGAGLILIISSVASGAQISAFALPAALIALFGKSLPIPKIGGLSPELGGMAVGVVILAVGILVGKRKI